MTSKYDVLLPLVDTLNIFNLIFFQKLTVPCFHVLVFFVNVHAPYNASFSRHANNGSFKILIGCKK